MGLQLTLTKEEILQEVLSGCYVQNSFPDHMRDDLIATWEMDLDGNEIIVVRDRADAYVPPPG